MKIVQPHQSTQGYKTAITISETPNTPRQLSKWLRGRGRAATHMMNLDAEQLSVIEAESGPEGRDLARAAASEARHNQSSWTELCRNQLAAMRPVASTGTFHVHYYPEATKRK